MYKNIYYDRNKSKIYLWEQNNGKDSYNIIDWVPYVFVPDENGKIKTLSGDNVRKKPFDNFKEYYEYQKGVKNIYENSVPCDIQFLAERYHNIENSQIEAPSLKTVSIDIEVIDIEGGRDCFPNTRDTVAAITLINVTRFDIDYSISWGLKSFDPIDCEDIDEFRSFNTEHELLRNFYTWWRENTPDMVTGWNVVSHNKMNPRGGFDLPYLINRTKVLFGSDTKEYKKLSPIGNVKIREDINNNTFIVDIAGVSVVDYQALYKWYTPSKPDNMKLDTVAIKVLDVGKLDWSEFRSFREFYNKGWEKFVVYNAIDNKRIKQIEQKLGYLKLAQNLALLCKTKTEDYSSASNLIEGFMLTYYRRNGLCAPYLAGGDQEWFPAAFVKDPQIGRYNWVIDIDVTSSYPFGIITLNMSQETYYGRCVEYYNEETGRWINTIDGRSELSPIEVAEREIPIVQFVANREFPPFVMRKDGRDIKFEGEKLNKFNSVLKKGGLTIAPCGSMFVTNKNGHMSIAEGQLFVERKKVRKNQNDCFKSATTTTDVLQKRLLTEKGNNFKALQTAIKVVLNGMYGVTGVPYSRYFNVNISEAIASVGRRTVLDGAKHLNELYNKPTEDLREVLSRCGKLKDASETVDFVAYIDTDSLFITVERFILNYIEDKDSWLSIDDEKKTEIVLEIAKITEDFVNECAYNITQLQNYNSQEKEFRISFKQEIVCRSALFVTKKKYGYHVINDDRVKCDKIDVKGLEIIRSETPSFFREALKDLLGLILKNEPDEVLLKAYNKYKSQAISLDDINKISENKGVKGLDKYIINGKPIKGTPYHVKAVANYHFLLKKYDLEGRYPEIQEDSKNKLLAVKENPYGFDCIMFDEWCPEFEEHGITPDRAKMIQKHFTKKLEMLLAPIGLEHIIHMNQTFGGFFKKKEK